LRQPLLQPFDSLLAAHTARSGATNHRLDPSNGYFLHLLSPPFYV